MTNKSNDFYEFGDFRLDARAKILYHADTTVALKPKVVETLVVLIENAGEVVGKTDLMNAVWQDSFVEENNLSVNIYALRKAFARYGDAGQTYIQTVSRRGFRFAVHVKKVAATNGGGHRSNGIYLGQKSNAAIETENAPAAASSKNGEPADDGNEEAVADSIFVQPAETKDLKSEISNLEAENNFKSQTPNPKSPPPFARRNLVVTALIIIGVFAVGGSLYAIRENRRSANQTLNAGATRDADQFEQRGTKSIEAYQLYLRGRELWQTRNNSKMLEGIEFFRRAIELDPQFAAPYLGIADSLSMMRNDQEDWRQAEVYAAKAIELQPDSADAHATLGFIYAMNKWQWTDAETSFRKALALDERSGKAHQWYATLLLFERRFAEAEAHLKRAIEIEPLSPNYNIDLCEFYLLTKRDEEMFAQCRRANEINPDFLYVFYERVFNERQKRYDEAAEAWIKAMTRFGRTDAESRRSDWYLAFQKDGYRGWMLSDIERNRKSSDALLGVWHTSVAYAKLGDREKTLEYLEKALVGKTFLLPFANVNPEFDFLRDDARFQDLMRRVGLR